MAAKSTVAVRFTGDVSDLKRSLDHVDGQMRGLGSKFASFGKAAAVGLGVAAVGAVALGKGFVDAAVESQKVTKQTDAVLKSMGTAAGVTAKQVAALSTKLSLQTGIDDELIQSGENLLLTFGNVRNGLGKNEKNFDRATAAALDMSVALGKDMKDASMLVGKALNDPVKGLTALTRSGIQFTAQQKDQIKWMVATGDAAGAQRIMLDELERQFGGSAAAQATAGEKLKVVWGNLQEQLGEKLLPMFEKVATWLSEHLPGAIAAATPVLESLGRFFKETGEKVAAFVKEKLSQLREWWDEHGPAITETMKGLGEDVQTYLVAPFTALVAYFTEHLLPKLGEFATWVAENKKVLEAFGVLVGTTLVAHFGLLATASVAAAARSALAWGLAVAPLTAMLLTVAALTAATTWLVNTPEFGEFLQWGIDMAAWALKLARALERAVPQLGALVSLAKTAAGLIPDIPGLGPSEATVNPLTGLPVKEKQVFARAMGGPVSALSPYMVGERGPELFVPGAAGSIVPNHALGDAQGRSVTVIVNNPTQEPLADSLRTARREAALMGA